MEDYREAAGPRQTSEQIARYIREQIYDTTWGSGIKIPSENSLASKFGVSRGTARRAIKLLVDEGLLVQQHGRGTFVRVPTRLEPKSERALSFASTLHANGVEFVTRVVLKEVVPATPTVAENLTIAAGSPVLHSYRVRVEVGGRPLMVLDSWIPLDVCPGADKEDLASTSLFDIVERTSQERIGWSNMSCSALAAGAEAGEHLQVPESAPVLLLEQVIHLASGTPAEWSSVFLPSGFTITGVGFQSPER